MIPVVASGATVNPPATAAGVVQRKTADADNPNVQSAAREGEKKPELEFRSAMGFSGVPVTAPDQSVPPSVEVIYPEEDRGFVIAWRVWNTGWRPAPWHANALTIYDARVCSGCKRPEDEVYRHETLAPGIVSIRQPGKSEYPESFWVSGLPAGRYEAFGEIDVHDEVGEINEDNNTQFMIFDVKPRSKSTP